MRKIFIDAGAFDGDTVNWFNKHYAGDEYEIFAFEANPALAHHFDDLNVNFLQKAVWIEDGTIDFFIGGDPTGSTLCETKDSGMVDYSKPVNVECVNISKWIKDNFEKEDYIIFKMDIEGAEFEVIPHMIDDGSLEYIDELWVEFHPNKIRKYTTDDKNHLLQRIKENDLILKDWH